MPHASTAGRLHARRTAVVATALALAASLAVALAACGSTGASPAGSAPPATPANSALSAGSGSSLGSAPDSAPGSFPAGTQAPSTGTEAPPTGLDATPFGSPAPPVQIDDALADLLPATVDGIAVERSAETESAALTSPTLGADADGFAAVQVATPDLTDLAIASIVHLKGSTDPDTFYAGWRPAFDEAVCAPAGGISATEVRSIAGRTADTTLCAEGARVYHVRLDGGRIVVSVLDVGTRGFGQGLLEGLED